jgi:hypothetical protein
MSANPKKDCPYCNKSIITTRLGKHFLGPCKTAFVEANKKKFTSDHVGYMACRLKNEELIYINLATQSSCMKEKMIWSVVKKDGNTKKHQEIAKQLLQELGELKAQEKPIEDISMNTLMGVDIKKIQDNSGAFFGAICYAKKIIDNKDDIIDEQERIIEQLKKLCNISDDDYKELEDSSRTEDDDKSDLDVKSLFKDRTFLKEHREITNEYVSQFKK